MTTPALKSELNLSYSRARVLGKVLLGIYLLVLLLVASVRFAPLIKLLAFGLVAAHGFWAWTGWQKLGELQSLRLGPEPWLLVDNDKEYEVTQTRPPLVLAWLVVLYLKSGGKRWTIPVVASSVGEEPFRALKVLLRSS